MSSTVGVTPPKNAARLPCAIPVARKPPDAPPLPNTEPPITEFNGRVIDISLLY